MIRQERIVLVLVLGWAIPTLAQTTYTVTMDTTERVGQTGQIAFDFTSSDSSSNIVTISDFLTDGTIGLPLTQGGLVEGDLILLKGDGGDKAPITTIKDSAFFNQLVLPITFGAQITFKLQMTEFQVSGSPPDEFAFFVLDTNGKIALLSLDPLGANALLTIESDGTAGGNVQVFSPATISNTDISIKVSDLCPDDPNKTFPGVCGCGVSDTDTDGDGIVDCLDGCPNDPDKTAAGQCGCGTPDTDTDGNGVADCVDTGAPASAQCGSCGAGMPQALSLSLFGLMLMQMRRRRA